MNAHSRGVSSVRHRDSLGIGTRIRAKLDFVLRLDTRATPKNVACDKTHGLSQAGSFVLHRTCCVPASLFFSLLLLFLFFFYHGQCLLNRVKSSVEEDCSSRRETTNNVLAFIVRWTIFANYLCKICGE